MSIHVVNKKDKKKSKGKAVPSQKTPTQGPDKPESQKEVKEGDEINEADYIPVAKKAIIGQFINFFC